MNYVVQVTLTIRIPLEEGDFSAYREHCRVTTLPATSLPDANELCAAISMCKNRIAEVCISVPKARGSVIMPLAQVHNITDLLEKQRFEDSLAKPDREASTFPRKPTLSMRNAMRPREPQPGDDN
jgi:hypothetical protein